MILYYIRHGDPVYNPDTLTELGKRQAEALGKRLALYGLDRIYSSPSIRAVQTAEPTSFLTKKEIIELDWCQEKDAFRELSFIKDGKPGWLFTIQKSLMASKEMEELGHNWWKHPAFEQYNYESGYKRIQNHTHNFLAELGYKFDKKTGVYKVLQDNSDRIALFAHQGFGIAFLSCVLNIPYPMMCKFDLGHSSMTVVNFENENGVCVPRVLSLSNDSHLYREGLPTKYNNFIYI